MISYMDNYINNLINNKKTEKTYVFNNQKHYWP